MLQAPKFVYKSRTRAEAVHTIREVQIMIKLHSCIGQICCTSRTTIKNLLPRLGAITLQICLSSETAPGICNHQAICLHNRTRLRLYNICT